MKRSGSVPVGLLFAALALPAAAAEPPALPDPAWTVDDVVLAENVREADVARDGGAIVWVKSAVERVEGEEKPVANLWLLRLSGAGAAALPGGTAGGELAEQARPLTRGTDRAAAPALSPDGRKVAFLFDREPPGGTAKGEDERGRRQVWIADLAGGEPWPVTSFDRDVRGFAWSGLATLVVLAQEARSAHERRLAEAKDGSVVVEDADREPPVRLFRVGLDGESARITANEGWIDLLAVSPDGRQAIVRRQTSLSYEFDGLAHPETLRVDLATGATARLFAAAGRPVVPVDVQWSPDGSGFYFSEAFSRHPVYRTAAILELYFHHLGSGDTVRLTGDPESGERGLGGSFLPTPRGVLALLADGVQVRPVEYLRPSGPGPWKRRDVAGRHAARLDDWLASADGGTVFYRHSTAATPAQWWMSELADGRMTGERRATDLNRRFAGKPTGSVEILRWPGALGDEVEGLLYHPVDPPGRTLPPGPRPLILDIHGGPTGTDMDRWQLRWPAPHLLWRQRGAFVLQVNYHGSAGYGLDWVESLRERYYELEIPDIEAGVDLLIERGLVDPERLATSGWSNGGILSAELITRTRRYRAASIGAADVEWISDWGNVDFGATFDNYYFGGPPWEATQAYLDKSPFFRLGEVTTPTVVYTGTADRNVPPHQSWSLFRALQQMGRAPVRLVLFPGEPHGLGKPAFQRRKIEEDLAWFDRYLFARESPATEAVRDGSPLAALLARSRAARDGGSLGRRAVGSAGAILAPETALFRGLAVGRFEVTRAQWAAFEPAAAPAPGEENLPAAGVPFERAQEYVAWLAQTTGEPWRLPTAAEAEALAQAARGAAKGSGNTLERWAGYAPNPEDRARLAAAAAEAGERLGLAAPLLLPVGSLPGAGDDPVFDLDGNVAEWAVGKDGAGLPAGPSADRAEDPRGSETAPAAAYVGLRVVQGAPPPPAG